MKFIPQKKTSPVTQYDKSQETDSQMLIRIGKKFTLLSVIIFFADTLFDWVVGLLDLLMEGIHLVIETIEYSIELILQNTLDTSHQDSEIIIVNSTIIICLYLLYRLYLITPKLCSLFTKKCSLYLDYKSTCWQSIPFARKLKLASAYGFGITCLLFLVTL